MILVAILGLVLLGVAVVIIVRALVEPGLRRSENLAQIDAYGYARRAEQEQRRRGARHERNARESLDRLASSVGELVSSRLLNVREEDIQRELIQAGFFRVGPKRFLGYRVLIAIALMLLLGWLAWLFGGSGFEIFLLGLVGLVGGWVGPSFVVHRRARQRLEKVDQMLPAMIDLLVVTLEAGVAFTAALRMASDRLGGPLGEELRLTIQEQALGLSTLEALENWMRRCDTVSVRAFVRAMVQGDRLGVSIGQILRNQATELRARQRHAVEERAQKAPIKILFPLVFLIFPAMFVVILGPAMYAIAHNLHG
jgi:tight adherence protein C